MKRLGLFIDSGLGLCRFLYEYTSNPSLASFNIGWDTVQIEFLLSYPVQILESGVTLSKSEELDYSGESKLCVIENRTSIFTTDDFT
jgi:hypothetical protein